MRLKLKNNEIILKVQEEQTLEWLNAITTTKKLKYFMEIIYRQRVLNFLHFN